jgi:transcriptional regulator with XRE-family HTH domain
MKRLLLQRLQNRFIRLIEEYLRKHDMTQDELAAYVGIQPSHLSNLMRGRRVLSATYLLYFIAKGIIMPEDIYDGKSESERENEFWETVNFARRIDFLRKVVKKEKQGYNIEAMIDALPDPK